MSRSEADAVAHAGEPGPRARLARLQRYLQQDPDNALLLGDACDAAIEAGEHGQALAYAERAERRAHDALAWAFRRARICIARRELDTARRLLEVLRDAQPSHPVFAHDLAWIDFLQGDHARCRAAVAPWLEGGQGLSPDRLEALQVVWLRASHRLGLVGEALQWAQQQEALQPAAQGVASLLAIDAGDYPAALKLADAALQARPTQPEALVARATVALARGETRRATQLLVLARAGNAEDGRVGSMLGLAHLREGDLPQAQRHFEQALRTVGGHVGTWHALGWTRLLRQDLAGALEAFSDALALDRNFAESHGAVGLVLGLLGRAPEAEHHLRAAERLDRANVTGRYARALLQGEVRDARQLRALAATLLQRPGFFGGQLADSVPGVTR